MSRYRFSSQEAGLIATSAHIGGLSAILFVSHFGAKSHKPRILAIGTLVCGIGSCFRAMPHFLGGPYNYGDTQNTLTAHSGQGDYPLCHYNRTEFKCPVQPVGRDRSSTSATIWLVIGQLLGGAGFSPMASLAPVIFEESMGGAHTPIFIAITNSVGAVGIACGYLLGALCLRVFVDIGREVHIDNRDPRWVGAWWLLFMVTFCLMTLDSILLFAFPSRIPSRESLCAILTPEQKADMEKSTLDYLDADEQEREQRQQRKPSVASRMTDIPKSVWKLLKIPAFVLLVLTGVVEVLLFSSISSFGTKLFEENFQLTATMAGLAMGGVATIGGAGGTLGGGILMRKLKQDPKTIARLCSISALVAGVASLSYVFYCQPPSLAGLQVPYTPRTYSHSTTFYPSPDGKLNSPCNSNCGCHLRTFSPVCGADGITYFSPCHAGCLGKENVTLQTFGNCNCIKMPSTSEVEDDHESGFHHYEQVYTGRAKYQQQQQSGSFDRSASYGGEVTRGRCGPVGPCSKFYIALPFMILGVVFRSFMVTPLSMLILRSVPVQDKAFGLGLEWLGLRLLGTIPGPILLGTIIDSACAVWQLSCRGSGQCWVYNLADLNLRLALYWAGTCILTAMLCFWASRFLSSEVMDSVPKAIALSATPPLRYVSDFSEDEKSDVYDNPHPSSPKAVSAKVPSTPAASPKSQQGIYENVPAS
ncbi:hypothetical protein BaRGS_00006243 [Batillaria attramentaria]|uniref:Kazal-like domain-containing protein n=1 Tax=Batillaria attramentaria TaxID=370345 RepID=A0ABD0LSM3_9CAEN